MLLWQVVFEHLQNRIKNLCEALHVLQQASLRLMASWCVSQKGCSNDIDIQGAAGRASLIFLMHFHMGLAASSPSNSLFAWSREYGVHGNPAQ